MRQWNIDTKCLCKKHLLGEHHELHYAAGYLAKGNRSIEHWTKRNFLELSTLRKRHKELVVEMKRRGYNHKSPLQKFSVPKDIVRGKIDLEFNRKDLQERCKECSTLITT